MLFNGESQEIFPDIMVVLGEVEVRKHVLKYSIHFAVQGQWKFTPPFVGASLQH